MKTFWDVLAGIGFVLMCLGAAGFDSNMLAGGIMTIVGLLVMYVCSLASENYTND